MSRVPKHVDTSRNSGTLLISPHADDVALSIGGAIISEYFPRPFLLTIFSGSRYAPFSKFHGKGELATKKRLREDQLYCNSLRLGYEQLPFGDTTMRGYKDLECIRHVQDPATDPVFAHVKAELLRILSSNDFVNVVCPLGIGNHVDHLIVGLSVEEIFIEADLKVDLFFYEDLPYAGFTSLSAIEETVGKTKFRLTPLMVDISSILDRKIACVTKCYDSQIGKEDLQAVISHAKRLAKGSNAYCERIWFRSENPTDS